MRVWRNWWLPVALLFAIAVTAAPVGYIYLFGGVSIAEEDEPKTPKPNWEHWLDTTFGKPEPAGAFGFHIFDVLNTVLLFATLIWLIRSVDVAEAALSRTHHAYVRALVDTRYDAMDKLYFDLLRESRERSYPA